MRPILHPAPLVARSCRASAIAASILIVALAGCDPKGDGDAQGQRVFRDQERFGLSFEERMAIPSALTRIRGEAQRRAAEIYDPFRSRENAVRNEEYFTRLQIELRAEFLEEKDLSEDAVKEIVAEYQASLGADLR